MEDERIEAEPPTVRASYDHAWETLKAEPGRLFLLLGVFLVLQIPGSIDTGDAGNLLSGLYQLLVVGPLTFGLSYAFLVAIRGRAPEVGDLFAPFQRAYLPAVAASVLLPIVLGIAAVPAIACAAIAGLVDGPTPLFVLLAIGLLALPLFAAVRLSFVAYLIVEEELGPIEVLGESWARTEAMQRCILGVMVLSVPLLIGGLLLFVVGVFPAMIIAGLALASVYDAVTPPPPEVETSSTSSDDDQTESGTQTPWNP